MTASTRGWRRSATSCNRNRKKARRPPRRPRRGFSFDDVNLYVAARCWDSHPEREVADELRRDNGNILGNENITFVIDTFHDRRNGYLFQTNPLGALRDMTVTDDLQNSAWNGIWYVKTGRFAQGWTMEVAIPFKTLRYRGSGAQTWGINLRRLVKWKNGFAYLSLVPAALGTQGQPDGLGGDDDRPRDPGAVGEPRAQALRGVVGDHGADRRRARR